jgi:acyl carrier protein
MVELDADLEADLGIDSIKKAQLFGELAYDFDVKPSEDFSLDDFPTLRHVKQLLETLPQSVTTRPNASAMPVAAPPPASTTPIAESPAPAAAPPSSPTLSGVALEEYLINFVVEQTGYPPEMVELDADLEADLGIDSIKKAQLFGELANEFDVQASEDLSLDEFPTLRHVKEFLESAASTPTPSANGTATSANSGVSAAAAPQMAAPTASAGNTLSGMALEEYLVNFVVEQTGYPPEMVELDADLEADLGIDSIKKAQLFGELANEFDAQASDDLSLDDFPTLRHVKAFLENAQHATS